MTKQRIIEHLQSLIDSYDAVEVNSAEAKYIRIWISETDVEALEEAKVIVKEAADDGQQKD